MANCKRGFTLIELLVVVAIIGVLASVVLASLSDARGSARDSQRVQMLKQLQISLELYRNANGGYPATGSMETVYAGTDCVLSTVDSRRADWIPGLVSSGYIASLPANTSDTGCYMYASNGRLYVLSAWNAAEGSYTTSSNPLYSLAGFREVNFDQNCFYNHPNILTGGFYNRSFTMSNVTQGGTYSCTEGN